MLEPFETWAPKEIRRLREEADILQIALDRFAGSIGLPPRRQKTAGSNAAPTDGQGRRSKYEALFAIWAEASRDRAIGYAAMERIANEAGFPMNRNLLRSTVHSQKLAGRTRAEGDGYVWEMPDGAKRDTPEAEAAPSVQEDAAS